MIVNTGFNNRGEMVWETEQSSSQEWLLYGVSESCLAFLLQLGQWRTPSLCHGTHHVTRTSWCVATPLAGGKASLMCTRSCWMGNRGSMLLSELVSVYFSGWVSHGPGCDKLLSSFSVTKLYTVTDTIHCWYFLMKSRCLMIQLDFTVRWGLSVHIRARICLLYEQTTCTAN